MKLFKLITVLIISVCMLVPGTAAYAFKLDSEVSFVPEDANAYVTMTDTIKTNNLTVAFGSQTSVTDAASVSLEKVSLAGVNTQKIYYGTDIYITADKTKLKGSKYLVLITYYDFGPDQGNFHFEYNSSDATLTASARAYKRYTIRKTGMNEKWTTVSILIDDAAFTGAMYHGADMRIVNGAYNAFAKIEIIDYSDCEVTNLGKITPTSTKDSVSNNTWQYMNFSGKPAIRPYVTAQGWNYEGTKFIFGSYDTLADGTIDSTSYKIYEYDIVNYTVRCLDTETAAGSGGISAVVTPDNYIYYAKADGKTWKMNWLTYEKEPTKAGTYGTMNVTNDGKWISGYGGSGNEVCRSNTQTGETEAVNIDYAKSLWVDNTYSMGKGHPMINPEYPHLLFFCHEGTTSYIPDRLWLANFDTGDTYNMFVQVPYSDTETAETSGHEVWSMDGEMMYWVKYTYKNNAGQSGLMRTDKFGSNREYINGDYTYWHCYPSADHNFVAADTNDRLTKVAVVNTNTYESAVVASFNNENSAHPNQPHPHISYNSYALNWQLMKNGVTCIGWDEIRSITAHPTEKQILPFGDYANVITCEGAVSETSNETVNGVTYKKADAGNGIYIDILSKVCACTNADVILEVTYLDEGTNTLDIVYTAGVEDVYDLATREDKTYSIAKTGSNIAKTAVVNLGSINANNIGKFMSDLYFTSADGAYISDVKVITDVPGKDEYDSNETGLLTEGIIYRGYEHIASKSQRIGVAADNNAADGGLQATELANAPTYDSTVYHVDDTAAWTEAGFTQDTIDTAIANGCSYVTPKVDGAWKYEEVTDADGVTKTAFYAPRNYRPSGTVNSNVYFKVTDETITEADNNLIFAVEYLDKGNKITVHYVNNSGERSSFVLGGTGTGKWQTQYVAVNDAALSSSNSDTKLATWAEDIKVNGGGADVCVAGITIMKVFDGTSSEDAEIIGGTKESMSMAPGDIASACAFVVNKTNTDAEAFAAAVVYNADGTIKNIYKSQNTAVAANKTAELALPEFVLCAGETYRTFVWGSNLAPLKREKDPLDTITTVSDDGTVTIRWNNASYPEYLFNIYCDGELVGRSRGASCVIKDIEPGSYVYTVDVVDSCGKVKLRSADINVQLE